MTYERTKANIIKTNDGYMIQMPNGDCVADNDGNNLFDSLIAVFEITEKKNISWKIEIGKNA